MIKPNSIHTLNGNPPPRLLPVLEKLKTVYILWHEYHEKLPKTQKYSLGNRIDKIFIEIIEMVASAAFLPKSEKLPFVKIAIRKLDVMKILIMILWETRSLDEKKYIALSLPLDEVGKMLGGWQGQLIKNSPDKGEK